MYMVPNQHITLKKLTKGFSLVIFYTCVATCIRIFRGAWLKLTVSGKALVVKLFYIGVAICIRTYINS